MKKIILLVFTALALFTGCNETPRVYYNSGYYGEPIKVAENLYFKQVYIQDIKALLQCDKDGNIIHGQNINAGYQQGKVFVNTAIASSSNDQSNQSSNFNFKCTDIDDCYSQVLVVKNSLSK
jgi:hypothetical protein